MKRLATTVMALALLASACAHANQAGAASETGAAPTASVQDAQTIPITRSGSQPSRKGPAEYFTGSVRIDPLFQMNDPSRTSGSYVTFEPGVRSAWHTHPLGQILIVTAGTGLVQRWSGPIEEIRPGDVVRIPPGQKHWHGASQTTRMTHIAIQESLDGKNSEQARAGAAIHFDGALLAGRSGQHYPLLRSAAAAAAQGAARRPVSRGVRTVGRGR